MPELRQKALDVTSKISFLPRMNGIPQDLDAQLTAKRVKVDSYNAEISIRRWLSLRLIAVTTVVCFVLTSLLVLEDIIRIAPDYLSDLFNVAPAAPNAFFLNKASRGILRFFSRLFANWNMEDNLQEWLNAFNRLSTTKYLGYPSI